MILDQKKYIDFRNKTLIALDTDGSGINDLFAAIGGEFTVTRVHSENEVLEKLSTDLVNIAAVLFSAELIDHGAAELMRKIESDARFVEIPVIAVSDSTDGKYRKYRKKCIDAGVNEFFEPPFDAELTVLRLKNAARAKDAVTFNEMAIMLRELPSNIYLKDTECRYIFSSHYWHHLTDAGESFWTIRGKTDYDIQKDPAVAKKAYDADKEMIASGKGSSYILDMHDDGIQEYLQVIKSPTFDSSGNVSGIIAIMNDVTELELLKRKLEKRTDQIDAELRVASVIQLNMLPAEFEKHDRVEINATMIPAKNVGGDFYDYFFIDDDHIALVMADVSGKGIPAALGMTITKIVLHDRALAGGTPAEIVSDSNNRICLNNKMQLFITVWFGILDLTSGVVTYTNAGHEYPAIKNGDSSYKLLVTDNLPPIGTIEDIPYENASIKLEPGDRLFLYTDGVTDVKNDDGKRFGIDRMTAALDNTESMDTNGVVTFMNSEINRFVGNAERFDDTTMMSVKYLG